MSEQATESMVVCPRCGQYLPVESDYTGSELKCQSCGKRFSAPPILESQEKPMKSFRLAPLTPHDRKELKKYGILWALVIGVVICALPIFLNIAGVRLDSPTESKNNTYRQDNDRYRNIALLCAYVGNAKTPQARAGRGLMALGSYALGLWLDHKAEEIRRKAEEECRRLEELRQLNRSLPHPLSERDKREKECLLELVERHSNVSNTNQIGPTHIFRPIPSAYAQFYLTPLSDSDKKVDDAQNKK